MTKAEKLGDIFKQFKFLSNTGLRIKSTSPRMGVLEDCMIFPELDELLESLGLTIRQIDMINKQKISNYIANNPAKFVNNQINNINNTQAQLDKIELKLYKDAANAKNNDEYQKYYNEALKLRELNSINRTNLSEINYRAKNGDYIGAANAINNYVSEGTRVLNEFETPYKTPTPMPENKNIDFTALTNGLSDTSRINHPKNTQPIVQNHVHYVINQTQTPKSGKLFDYPVATGYAVPIATGYAAPVVNNQPIMYSPKPPTISMPTYEDNMQLALIKAANLTNELKALGLIFDYKLSKFQFEKYLEDITLEIHLFNILLSFLNSLSNITRPEARLLMNLALRHPKDFERKDAKYFIIPRYFNQAISKTTGVDIPKNWNGIYFYPTSSLAKALSNSPQLQRQVKEQCINGKFKNNRVYIDLTEDKNLQYSIGHATIINAYIDKDGHFHGLLYDKYDFDYLPPDERLAKKKLLLNNGAYKLQEYNILRNYYLFVPIMF